MSDLNDQLRDEMHAAFYEYTGTDGSKLPHYDGEQWTDFAAGFDAARRAPAAAPAPVAASELPPLPTFMRAHIERAITEAEQTRGFGVHDGMARLNVGYLKRIYGLADAAAQLHAAAAAPIVQPAEVSEESIAEDVYGHLCDLIAPYIAADGQLTEKYPFPASVTDTFQMLLEHYFASTTSTADAKDAARLDYLQKHARCDPKMDGKHVWWPTAHKHALRGPTLREAIDAAIATSADEVKS